MKATVPAPPVGLDPQAEQALDLLAAPNDPPLNALPLGEARHRLRDRLCALTSGEEVALVQDLEVGTGRRPVRVRTYWPTFGGDLPAIAYFHGGGWVLGDLDSHDGLCRRLANRAGAVVVSVDYRRAPERRFPAALEDGHDVVAWLEMQAPQLGVDPRRIAVAGDSAGANLATVVARDRVIAGDESLAFQVLVCPMVDATLASRSIQELGDRFIPRRSTLEWFYAQYLPPGSSNTDPRVSPLLAPDLSGLPPALVITAEFDPLRDEGASYAARLDASGVATELHCYPGMVHAFVGMDRVVDRADDALSLIANALRAAWDRRVR